MAINISAWSIRQPLPPIVMAAAIIALGYISFNKLPITRLPNVDVPVISVVITQFGAAPAELESQVTKKVEDAVAGVEGSHHISSSITDGISATTIIFRFGTDTDRALNDVKDSVTRIRGDLPRTIDEPMIQRIDIAGLPILTYAAISPGKTPEQLSWFVEDVVIRALQGVRGVGSIERIGSVEREIRVGLDPVRLQGVGLTALDVSRQLRASNVDLAGGRAEIAGRDQAIRTLAGAKTLPDLAATRIALPTGGDVQLDDLGLVTDTVAEPRTFARFDGTPIVGFNILRSKGASDVVVAEAVAARIEAIKAANPDINLQLIETSVTQTLENYHSALQSLYEGAALAVIIVLLFLHDLRATIIAAITLPLSILPAFWVMDIVGFSLNMVSLLAITLSTGILVDDAIVEIENIVRHIQMGKSPYQAALEAADEIGLAVIAISLTIVAVFVPASFMSSIPGQFFKQFGITVSVQVLFSLLCARLITPMLAAYFLRPHQHEEKVPGRIMRIYTRLVTWSVRHRFITVILAVILFVASMAAATLLPTGFLPTAETSRSLLAVELPPGSQLVDTEAVTNTISNRLRRRAEVESIFVDGGRIPPGVVEVRKAALTINYVPKSKRSLSQQQLELAISQDLADIPDVRYWFLDENGKRNVTYIVTGRDNATVANVASELTAQMRQIPIVTNVVSTATLSRPELRIYPRRDLAVRLGVSTESLSETIRVSTIGDVGPALAKLDAGDRVVPIRVLLEEKTRADQQVLEQIRVPSARGVGLPLTALAEISFGEGPISIDRFDRQRQGSVGADLVGDAALSDASAAVKALPVMKGLPPGINVFESGDAELQAELFEGFGSSMRNGLMMVYVVLSVLFASLLQPLTILFSLPLSIAGAIIALVVTGSPITTPVVIGILMLMGIVTKNAIMLVDFAVEAMHKGVDRTTAIIEAGQKRARPIVMTTLAMTAGMAPSALAFGAGAEFRSPMAIAVIGGLLVSTFLSLLFVPALFTLMDDLGRHARRVFGLLTITAAGAVLVIGARLALPLEVLAAEPTAISIAQVTVVRAVNACFSAVVRGTGFLVPREEAMVFLDTPGFKVTEVLAREGDRVTSGQTLARLTRESGDTADPATARRATTATLRAPAAGVVTRNAAVIGAVASPMVHEPMFRVAINNEIELEVEVSSVHVPELASGQTARIEIEDGRGRAGLVRLAPAGIDQSTQLGRARLSLESDPSLRIGMFATASIVANRSCGISVPTSAVIHRTEGTNIYVVRDAAIQTRTVQVGLHSDTATEIRDGLHEGDVVVANAGSSLRDGDKVTVIFSDGTQ